MLSPASVARWKLRSFTDAAGSWPPGLLNLRHLHALDLGPLFKVIPGELTFSDKVQLIENWFRIVVNDEDECLPGFYPSKVLKISGCLWWCGIGRTSMVETIAGVLLDALILFLSGCQILQSCQESAASAAYVASCSRRRQKFTIFFCSARSTPSSRPRAPGVFPDRSFPFPVFQSRLKSLLALQGSKRHPRS